jgi:hypothetical protein
VLVVCVTGTADVLVVCVTGDGEDAVVDLIAEPRPATESVVHAAQNIAPAIAPRPDGARPAPAHILIRCPPHGPRGTRDLGFDDP